ncbi:MAG: RNA-binding transcriptional accessory protein, partial [Oscillospiraceae bacterium]|nr:RNA-binding transcriptional accessory protein [Oscillospiraceae bacterium]
MDSIIKILSTELNTPEKFIENVVSLIDEGNTIPFIARYRKELHGGMDDTALRTLEDRLSYLRNLEKRREEVKSSIAAQEKLTDELSSAIDNASTLAEIEDIYRPFRPKRRTRATMAKEKGLEGLATALLEQSRECPAPAVLAEEFINPDLGVETVEEALAGASDIIAEIVSDSPESRKLLRESLMRQAELKVSAAKEEDSVYRLYYDFSHTLCKLQGQQVLAV